MQKSTHPIISICIVNWNGGSVFLQCLESIIEQVDLLPSESVEVIIVDNNSATLDIDVVCSKKYVKIIRNKTNEMFAKGTNQSINYSNGEYLLLLNNDILLTKGLLSDLLKIIRRKDFDALVPLLISPSGGTQKSLTRLPSPLIISLYVFLIPLIIKKYDNWLNPDFNYDLPQQIPPTLQPAFSALLVTRKVWNELGGLDPQFPLLWNDTDWFIRFHNKKYVAIFEPALKMIHHHGYSVNKRPIQKVIMSTVGMRRYFKKHFHLNTYQNVAFDLILIISAIQRLIREYILNFKIMIQTQVPTD